MKSIFEDFGITECKSAYSQLKERYSIQAKVESYIQIMESKELPFLLQNDSFQQDKLIQCAHIDNIINKRKQHGIETYIYQ